jgi:Fic family protein
VRESDFTSGAPGRLVRTAAGNPAYVPAKTPREFALSEPAIALLDVAANRIGVLAGIARRLPNPHLLIAPYLRREAVLSSRIEGTQTTIAEIYAAEAEQLSLVTSADVREVQNYIDAYQYGLERLATLPLSLRLIRELHERLMTGVRGGGTRPGEFRRYQNFIGGTSEATASYVPPPVPEMRQALDDLERFMHERTLPPLVQMAILHYQFEAIHPFGDGNGRVGRLLMALFLTERGLMPQPLLYLSAYFERTRSEYYAGLMRVSTSGDWDGWIRYILTAVIEQAGDAAALADRLQDLQLRYRELLQQRRATANTFALVESLFDNQLVTAPRVQALLGVSAPTARATIRALEDAGIVQEVGDRRWRKLYRADEIFAIVRGDDAQPSPPDRPSGR